MTACAIDTLGLKSRYLYFMRTTIFSLTIFLSIVFFPFLAFATSYPFAPSQRLVGQTQFIVLQKQHAQIDHLARSYDIGFDALLAANPILTSSHPNKYGTVILLPTFLIVPDIKPNQVVINIAEKRMFFYHAKSQRLYVWPVGVGREQHMTPLGQFSIVRKRYKPIWYVPENTLKEAHAKGIVDHPSIFEHSPINPLGEYALNLSKPTYLIHGTHNASHVGTRNTSGCVNLYPEDIAEAYPLLSNGTSVKIINTPVKSYRQGHHLYIEVHHPLTDDPITDLLSTQKENLLLSLDTKTRTLVNHLEFLDKLEDNLQNTTGIPFVVDLYEPNIR